MVRSSSTSGLCSAYTVFGKALRCNLRASGSIPARGHSILFSQSFLVRSNFVFNTELINSSYLFQRSEVQLIIKVPIPKLAFGIINVHLVSKYLLKASLIYMFHNNDIYLHSDPFSFVQGA